MAIGFVLLSADLSILIVPGAARPRTPGDFFRVEKVTKKTLKKLRFLRIFLDYGGFCLRYDLFDSFSQCLPWADGSRISAATPWPFSLHRWVRLREARFFGETTGPPARCGRYCPSLHRARRPRRAVLHKTAAVSFPHS